VSAVLEKHNEKRARTVDISSIDDDDDENFPTAELQSDDNDEDSGDDTHQHRTELELLSDFTFYLRELTKMAA
jgi:hypothetical protein